MHKNLFRIFAIGFGVGLCLGCSNINFREYQSLKEARQSTNLLQSFKTHLISNESRVERNSLSCHLAYAHSIRDSYRRELEIRDVIRTYAESELYAQALEIAKAENSVWDLNFIARQYAQANQYEQALQVVSMIEAAPSRDDAKVYIAEQYIKVRQYEEAVDLADTLTVHANAYKARLLAQIAVSLERNGQQVEANSYFDESLQIANALDPGEKQFALFGISLSYARTGEYQKALDLIRSFSASSKVEALIDISYLALEHGQIEQFTEILSQAYQLTEAPYLLSKIANAHAEAGQIQQALEVVATLEDISQETLSSLGMQEDGIASWKAVTLLEIANHAWQTGQISQSNVIFGQSIRAIEHVSDDQLIADYWINFASANQQNRQASQTNESLSRAFQAALNIHNIDDQSRILIDIARSYSEAEEYDQAYATAQAIRDVLERENLIELFNCSAH